MFSLEDPVSFMRLVLNNDNQGEDSESSNLDQGNQEMENKILVHQNKVFSLQQLINRINFEGKNNHFSIHLFGEIMIQPFIFDEEPQDNFNAANRTLLPI